MKKIVFSLLVFLGIAASVSAQTERIKPVAGDMGLGFKVSGIADVKISDWKTDHFAIPQLLYRYYVSDKFAVRAGLGLNLSNKSYSSKYENRPVGGILTTKVDSSYTIKNTIFSIDPGVEYHLGSPATKVDPYLGVVLGISMKGKTEVTDHQVRSEYNNSTTSYNSQSDITVRTVTPGGMGFGGSLVCGFNYFFSDNFAIGAEYMLGYNTVTTSGTTEISTTGFSGVPGSVTPINQINSWTTKNTESLGSIRSTGGVNLSVFW